MHAGDKAWRLRASSRPDGSTTAPSSRLKGIVQVSANGTVHRTYDVEEAFEKLLAKWRVIWQRQDSVPELDQAAGGDLRRPGRSQPARWSLRATDLHASAQRRKGGSASFDGWEGDELSWLPLSFWDAFLPMINRWMRRGIFPEAMRSYRQVFIPKSNLDERDADPSDLRPISIGCTFNRIVSGAMLMH